MENKKRKKILVVDNYPAMLQSMARLLRDQGHRVLTAEDGLSALDVLKTFTPDVIFCELIMPNISGEKLCSIIRTIPELKDAYLVIISGVAVEERVNLSELGVDACIAKAPFELMSKHVLGILKRLDAGISPGLDGGIMGPQDVHAREVAKQLLYSKRHSEEMLDKVPEGILEINIQGKLIYANAAAQSIAGLPEAELLGSNFEELFHDSDGIRIRRLIELPKGVAERPPRNLPLMLNGKDVLLNVFPIKEGERGSAIIVMSDVTEQTKIETQLRHAQRMEAIGTLAGGIAHEFNNILWIISANVELAVTHLPEGNSAHKNLQRVQKACSRATGLVKQILSFGREGGHGRRQLDIIPIIKESLKFLRSSIPATIEIRQSIPSESGKILVDPAQVRQVLMNLCINAADAMRETGGVLEISMIDIELDEGETAPRLNLGPGKYLRLSVRDTGPGMNPEVLERIFDPFFTTKGVAEGRGMGLAMVHGIAKSHDGAVTVESDSGKGTTFHVFFPKVIKRAKPVDKTTKPVIQGREKVLFVDDEEEIALLGKEMIEFFGYHVESKTSSVEALETFRADPDNFDLVITDMTMPELTGEMLAKELVQIRPGIPIILCSGHDDLITKEKAGEIGIREIVLKPIRPDDFAQTIRKALDVGPVRG